MNRKIIFVIAVACVLASGVIAEAQAPPEATGQKEQAIDFDRARKLLQKRQRGDQLSSDEQTYLQRATVATRRMPSILNRLRTSLRLPFGG